MELYAISSNLNSHEINKGSELKITFHFQENAMIITQNLEFIIDKNVLGNRYPIHFNFNLQELR